MQKWQTPPKRIKDNVLIGSFQKNPKNQTKSTNRKRQPKRKTNSNQPQKASAPLEQI